jgi:PAS domain S-box-containing protein
MDDKAIPLSKPSIDQNLSLRSSPKQWGDDLHYRALFEQTGECVFIIGLDFHYLAANQQAVSLLGYAEGELIGMPVSAVMTQDDALGHQALMDEGSNLLERILKRKDGSTLPVEISTSVVYNESGEPAYIQSIARDISERKNAERILKRHMRILSVIADATVTLLRSSNIETQIPEVLQALGTAMGVCCCAIFEINTFSTNPTINVCYHWHTSGKEDFNILAVIRPYIPELFDTSSGYFSYCKSEFGNASSPEPAFVAIPINGNPGSWSFLGFFDDNEKLSWSSSEFDAAQTAANLIGSALQRNRYEETIRINETRNRIILDALPDLLIRIDVNESILDYSANAEHPLYIHRDLIMGKKLSQIWPPEIVQTIIGPANQVTFDLPSNIESFHLPHSNHIFESRLHPISPIEALIVIRDITEQARLNEMKSDFINRASHELRTPLTSSILMSELIQEGGTPEELDEYWRTLKSELNRQKILIDRLLIAGRLESGMMKLDVVPLDLLPVLDESLMAVKAIASKRRVTLDFEPCGEPVHVLGDKSGLQQVFINLINNAVKFSQEGGTVWITVAHDEDTLWVRIRDNGVGIPKDAIPHLFERFYRAKNVTIAEIPGSGIGLYIVKSIVEELGGTIQVSSVLNDGTTFAVCLKRYRASDETLVK